MCGIARFSQARIANQNSNAAKSSAIFSRTIPPQRECSMPLLDETAPILRLADDPRLVARHQRLQPRPAARAPGSKPTGRDNRRLSRRPDRRSAPARPRREHRPALVARPRPRPRSESAPGWFGWTGKVSATSSAMYCGASRSMVIGSRWLRLMSRWCRASGPPRHRRAYLGFGRSTGGGGSHARTRLRIGPESRTEPLRQTGMMAWRAGNFAVRSREFGGAEQGILGVGAGNF